MIYLGGYNSLEETENCEKFNKEFFSPSKSSNFGFVFTTKKLLKYTKGAVVEYGEDRLSTGWDSTWNLCHNRWFLANFRSMSTKY